MPKLSAANVGAMESLFEKEDTDGNGQAKGRDIIIVLAERRMWSRAIRWCHETPSQLSSHGPVGRLRKGCPEVERNKKYRILR